MYWPRVVLYKLTSCEPDEFQKCSSCCKLLLFYHCSSCYWCRARGIASVVCSIVLSKSGKPVMWDLPRAATWPMNLPTWLTSSGKFFSFKFCPLVKTSSSCKHYWSHWPGRVPCMHACAKYLLNLICNLNVLRIWTCLKQNLWSLIYHWWVELLFVFLVEFLFTLWLILI